MASPRWLLPATILLSLIPAAAASAAPSWTAGAAPGASATQSTVAYDGSGNATAAWVQTDSSGSSIWTARRDAGASAFGTATRLTAAVSSGTVSADVPELAVDSAGDAIVAWVAERPSGSVDTVTVATRSGAAGAWSAPVAASDTSLQSLAPTVGFSGNGTAVLAYDQTPSSGYAVGQVATVSTATSAVSAVQTITASSAAVTDLHLAFNASGAGELIWTETTVSFSPPYTGKSVLQGSYRAAGVATFPTPTVIYNSTPNPYAVDDAQVVLDASGTAGAVWSTVSTVDDSLLAVAASTKAPGAASWSGIYLSHTGASQPRIAVSATGDFVAAYVQGATDGSATDAGALRVARRAPGATSWATALDLTGVIVTAPVLAAGSQGTTVASWINRPGTGDTVQGAVLPAGSSTFLTPQNLDAPSGTDDAPAAAVDGNGNALVVWGRSGTTARAARLDGTTVVAPTPTSMPVPTPVPGPGDPVATPAPSTPTPTPTPNPITPSGSGSTTSNPGSGSGASAGTTTTVGGTMPATPVLPAPAGSASVHATAVGASAALASLSGVSAATASSTSVAPSLRAFKATSPRRFHAAKSGASLSAAGSGLRLAFTTNAAGTLRLIVTAVPSRGRAKNLTPVLTAPIGAGTTPLTFTGRLGTKRLPAGRYRLKAAFVDAAGRASNVRVLNIAISR